jgi:hypothetical protein
MPGVRKIGEKMFGSDFGEENSESRQNELLQTIRVPKNLLNLTDRLPKPHYERSVIKCKINLSSVVKGSDLSTILTNNQSVESLPDVRQKDKSEAKKNILEKDKKK